jgi:nucleoid-associated protein YgaU
VDGPAEVVVRPGDSLWSIAAAGLGPLASDEEIAVSWPRWYSRNAPAIGPDPGLLLPGQVLRAPEPP